MRKKQVQEIDSANEFLNNESAIPHQPDYQNQKVDEYQKMFMVFQKMATDPNLFMKMMTSVIPSVPPQPEPDSRKREFYVEQHKYRNQEVSPKRNLDFPIETKQTRKKGTDVLKRVSVQETDNQLEKYIQNRNQRAENLSQSILTVSSRQQHLVKVQDKPIKSSYISNQKNQYIKKDPIRQQINIPKYNSLQDERPIKPVKGYNYEFDSNQSFVNASSVEPVDPQKYWQAQNRPIKGIQGDFKQFVMKEQGIQISQQQINDESEDREECVPKAKPFLKRGSRQYLSSAKDRSVNKEKTKNVNKNTQKEQELDSSSFIKDPIQKNERSISQNRVLGRKSISSKSMTKKVEGRKKVEQEKKTLQYSTTSASYNTEVPPRSPRISDKKELRNRQASESPKFQVKSSLQEPKKKKMNIFHSSSSDEQPERQDKKESERILKNKTEVIPGVHLTKKQLHQILTKFGKQGQNTNSNENEIQQLKKKYIDLCNILAEQKRMFQIQMQKDKQEFELYKQAEITKIKNQRKVQQRNLINTQKAKEKQKEKQEFEAMRKVLEKEREQFKHKEKNYKIMVQKYKKMMEDKQKEVIQIRQIQQSKNQSQDANKIEELGTGTKKKPKIAVKEAANSQIQQMAGSSKGIEQNLVNIINRKQGKQATQNKEKDKLPNYQELKRGLNVQNSSQIVKQNTGPGLNNQSLTNNVGNQKAKKYEYYEQERNKNSYKSNLEDQHESPVSEEQEKGDSEEIVEYNPSMKLLDLTKIDLNIKMVNEEMIENLLHYQKTPQYRKYLQLCSKARKKIHTSRNEMDKKTTNIYADGGKEVLFDNGVRKQYFNNGYIIIFFANGDIKQKLPDKTELYFFREKQVDQITLPNNVEIFRFDNNQVQFHFKDKDQNVKLVQIRHPDGTFKTV